jgi:septal ring-binding cell division protein DamX
LHGAARKAPEESDYEFLTRLPETDPHHVDNAEQRTAKREAQRKAKREAAEQQQAPAANPNQRGFEW